MTRRSAISLLAFFTAAQALSILTLYASVGEAFSAEPLVNDDFPYQTWLVHDFRRFVDEHGRGWGYDPHFWAGYIRTFWANNAKPVQVFSLFVPWLTPGQVAKWFLLLTYASVPASVYATARMVGGDRARAIWSAALGTVYYSVGAPVLFAMFGMPAAGLMILLVPLWLACFLWFATAPTRARMAVVAALSALTALTHKSAPVLLVPGAVAALVVYARSWTWRAWVLLIAAAAIALAANLFWLIPNLHAMHYVDIRPQTSALGGGGLIWLLKDFVFPESGVWASQYAGTVLLLLGAYGFRLLHDREASRPRGVQATWAVATAAYFVLTYLGAWLVDILPGIGGLYARRWMPHFIFMFVIPAGWTVARLAPDTLRARAWAPAAAGVIYACLLVLLPTYRDYFSVAPLTTHVDPNAQRVMETLAEDTLDAEVREVSPGRILVEGSTEKDREGPGHIWSGGHLAITFPIDTGRPMIGGLPPDFYVVYSWLSFNDGVLAEREIGEYSRAELRRICALYNITDIVVWSSRAKAVFDAQPFAYPVRERHGVFTIYSVRPGDDGVGSYVIGGTADVHADMNVITVRNLALDAATPPRSVTLKFHWGEILRVDPPRMMRPVRVLDDPVPFIVIDDPPPNFRVYNSYDWTLE